MTSLGGRNQANVTTWSSFRWSTALSTSLRFDYHHWENISGHDSELPPPSAMVVPTADPDRRGGDRLDILVGANLYASHGPMKGHASPSSSACPSHKTSTVRS